MKLQFKRQNEAEIMYLEANKQQTKCHLIYIDLEIRGKPQFIFRTPKDT